MKLKFATKPWKHQLNAIKYLMPLNYGALYTDMGTGKTKIMIDLIVNRGFKKVIIVAPKKVCAVWPKEFTIHAPKSNIRVIDVSNISGDIKASVIKNNTSDTKFDQEVITVNYESIWREPFKTFLLKKYKADCVICDESHRIKSPSSKCSRFLQLLGKITPNRFLMTGTPLSQSPLDIYAQYRFLEPSIFGTNFNNFKGQYSNWINVAGGYSILDKKNPYKNLDELHDKMFACAFKADSDVELPETQDITIEYDMPKQSEKYYKEIQKEGCLEFAQGIVETSNVVSVVTKLQQILSGYLPLESDGVKTIQEIDSARQDALYDLLEGIAPDEPIVVFAKYTKDIKNIHSVCTRLNRATSELSGKTDTLKDWLEGGTQVLIVQIQSGAEGINLTRARYCIYYTLTYSLTKYLQSRKRVHRPSQTRPVVYYTLVCRISKGKTVDEHIVQSLASNKSLIDTIIENKEI